MISNKEHWTRWADTYGTSLRATTKTNTPKVLEIDCFARAFKKVGYTPESSFTAMEVGCGNGHNCFALASLFPNAKFHGVDFIDKMIDNAKLIQSENGVDNIEFSVGDVTKLNAVEALPESFDVIFTNRCLINLDSTDKQCEAISGLAAKLNVGGHLAMIENSQQTYDQQNICREILGLEKRTPAEFNLFFNEEKIIAHITKLGLKLEELEDFISLHDLLLYVLIPAVNGGKVDYEHPLVQKATELSVGISGKTISAFGKFGQNRLFLCKK